jgi:hypothetical protein
MKKKNQKKTKELRTLSTKDLGQVQGGCPGGVDESHGKSVTGGR